MTRRRCLCFVLAGLAAVGLSACGRRNQPEHPEGSNYPQDYPYAPPSAKANPTIPEGAAPKGDSTDQLRLDPKTGYQR